MNNRQLAAMIECSTTKVVDAMKRIDDNTAGILFVVDDNNRFVGTLSDGDIRRWLIRTGNLEAPINLAMNCNPKFLVEGNTSEAASVFKNAQIRSIPVVDENMTIIDVLFDDNEQRVIKPPEKNLAGVPVVIMAGGKGARLHPYTKILPKPLIPIGDIPIIERIINKFTYFEASDFYITINYRGGMIKSYFSELNPKYNINYVKEDIPMGTAGSIGLIEDRLDRPFFVSNCDILINTDYSEMYKHHIESGNALTAVAALKNIYVPYGVFTTGEQGTVSAIKEKPRLSYLVNTGMYILNPELIDMIPNGGMFHMTDLMNKLIDAGMKVGMYPVSEDAFLDMGEIEEMQRMEKKLEINNTEQNNG